MLTECLDVGLKKITGKPEVSVVPAKSHYRQVRLEVADNPVFRAVRFKRFGYLGDSQVGLTVLAEAEQQVTLCQG